MANKKEKDTKKKSKKKDTKKKVVELTDEQKAIIQPQLSEKSYAMANAQNKYSFSVPLSMNKIEIKKLVESIYDVSVEKVNVITRPGKKVTDWQRNLTFRRSDKKKAIVTLKEGNKIDEFFNI